MKWWGCFLLHWDSWHSFTVNNLMSFDSCVQFWKCGNKDSEHFFNHLRVSLCPLTSFSLLCFQVILAMEMIFCQRLACIFSFFTKVESIIWFHDWPLPFSIIVKASSMLLSTSVLPFSSSSNYACIYYPSYG